MLLGSPRGWGHSGWNIYGVSDKHGAAPAENPTSRCRSVNRAIMWFLPVSGSLVIFPVLVTSWADQPHWYIRTILMTTVTLGLTLGGWGFWKNSEKLFDRETVLAT